MSVIVNAVYEDRPKFLDIWMEMIQQERDSGSHIHATTKNLLNYARYFDAYTRGQMFGGCLFWMPQPWEPPQAVIMFGEDFKTEDWDTDRPSCATLWGGYVRPEFRRQNIGREMMYAICPELLKLGFHNIETRVRVENKGGHREALALGLEFESHLYVGDLTKIVKTGLCLD